MNLTLTLDVGVQNGPTDSTLGGGSSVFLLEDDTFGFLLEDGSSFWLIET